MRSRRQPLQDGSQRLNTDLPDTPHARFEIHKPRQKKTVAGTDPAAGSDNAAQREEERAPTTLHSEELETLVDNVIKAAVDNKVTKKNCWSVNIAPYLAELVHRERDSTNFHRASRGLEASAICYGFKVDETHEKTFQLLRGCNAHDEVTEADEDGSGGDGSGTQKRSRRAAHDVDPSSTLEDPAKLKVSSSAFSGTDPMFHVLSSMFDASNVSSLLFFVLDARKDTQLSLDSTCKPKDLYQPSDSYEFDAEVEDQMPDNLYPVVTDSLDQLKSMLGESVDANIDERDDSILQAASSGLTQLLPPLKRVDGTVHHQARAQPSVFESQFESEDEAEFHPDEDRMSVDHQTMQDVFDEHETEIPTASATQESAEPVENDGGGYVPTQEPELEYDEADDWHGDDDFGDDNQVPGSPGHGGAAGTAADRDAEEQDDGALAKFLQGFKMFKAPRRPPAPQGGRQPGRQRREVAPLLVFGPEMGPVPELKRVSARQTCIQKRDPFNGFLPEVPKSELYEFARPGAEFEPLARFPERRSQGPFATAHDNLNAADGACDTCEDHDGAWGEELGSGVDAFEAAVGSEGLEAEEPEEFDLLQAPRQVEQININYRKVSKPVDVRKLKNNLWRSLQSPEVLEPEAAQDDEISFQDVLRVLTDKQEPQPDLSVHLCFICLLHLANEHGLKLEGSPSLDSVVISNMPNEP